MRQHLTVHMNCEITDALTHQLCEVCCIVASCYIVYLIHGCDYVCVCVCVCVCVW